MGYGEGLLRREAWRWGLVYPVLRRKSLFIKKLNRYILLYQKGRQMKNRKLKGLILAVVLTFTLNSSVIAADNRAVDNIVSEDSGGYMSYDEFANQNMLQNNTVEVVEENEILNLGDKNQNDTFSEEIINLEPNMCLDNEMDNTSANYPLDIDSYESINGQLTETNENRWFRLQVQDSNRLAVLLLMDGTLDSDLYIYIN